MSNHSKFTPLYTKKKKNYSIVISLVAMTIPIAITISIVAFTILIKWIYMFFIMALY
jgi:hypothetical protein